MLKAKVIESFRLDIRKLRIKGRRESKRKKPKPYPFTVHEFKQTNFFRIPKIISFFSRVLKDVYFRRLARICYLRAYKLKPMWLLKQRLLLKAEKDKREFVLPFWMVDTGGRLPKPKIHPSAYSSNPRGKYRPRKKKLLENAST